MNTREKYCLHSVSRILDEVDVMDIVNITPPNEYLEEAKMILQYCIPPRYGDITETRISKIVSMVFDLMFGQVLENVKDKQEKFDLIAKKIMALK